MVDLGGDNVALFVSIEAGHSLETQVVRLSGSGREHDLLACSANQLCHLLSCIFTGLLGLPAVRVGPGMWVAVAFGQKWKHLVEDPKSTYS